MKKYALIGCGRISPNHIMAALNSNLEIVAICDIIEARMDETIRKFGLPATVKKYMSYQNMIENENLDLVAIATESGKHGDIALNCLDKGINLIIEKPIALSLEEASKIIEVSTRKGLVVSACHQNRFNKAILKLKDAVTKNRFGKLFYSTAHIRWNRNKDYFDQAPWRGTWEQDGGALMNQCIHNIDLLRWIMGEEIAEVFGVTKNQNHPYIEAEDLGTAIVKFTNGGLGIIEGTTNIYPNNLEETLFIFGEKGTVKIGGKSVNKIEEWIFSDDVDNSDEVKKEFSELPPNIYGFGHTPLYKDVIDAIVNDRSPFVTAEDGKNALELVLAIYLSSKTGQPVKLPLKSIKTGDFQGFFNN